MNEVRETNRIAFWVAVAVGWTVIVLATLDYLQKRGSADAWNVAKWVVGGNLVHDVIVVPIVLAIGFLVTRFVPEPWRTPVRAGLIGTGCVALVAIPLVGGFGLKPSNPSLLPLDYDRALLVAVGIVWLAAAAWLGLRLAHRSATEPRDAELS